MAAIFPAYDFTFYKTSDETLTSFNKNNIGIDVTGYGFVGTESTRGIYLRIGIQTPFSTLIKLKDSIFKASSITSTATNTTDITLDNITVENTTGTGTTGTGTTGTGTTGTGTTGTGTTGTGTTGTGTTGTGTTGTGTTGTENSDAEATTEGTGSSKDGETTTEQSGDTSILPSTSDSEDDSSSEKKKSTLSDTTQWKFLFSMGPAWRSTMGDNAIVYGGLGFTVTTEFKNSFNEDGSAYTSNFYAMLSLDIDAGFRVGLKYSRTTIRIGVHAITNLIGFNDNRSYAENGGESVKNIDFYGYIAGKNGIMGTTHGQGYIRLATTFTEKKRNVYNYSNRTSIVGRGTLTKSE